MLRPTLLFLLASVLVPAAALAEGELPSLAVLDVRTGSGIGEEIGSFATGAVARAASGGGAFRVISSEDIRALLTLEAQKSLCGADSESCLAEIGGALGADYLVNGQLTRLGERISLELSLLDVKRAKNLSRANRTFTRESEMPELIPEVTIELLGKALEGREGTLVLSISEPGASVKIDGRLIGVSPLAAQKVVIGTHLIEVEKSGFITQREQVHVPSGQIAARSVGLVPSPDFVQGYEVRASRMRLGAWIATGLAAATAGSAIAFNSLADRTHADFLQARDRDYPAGLVDREALGALASEGQTQQSIANVSLGIAGAAGVAAVYFWIAGEPPGRYGRYQIAAGPTVDGAFASATLRF